MPGKKVCVQITIGFDPRTHRPTLFKRCFKVPTQPAWWDRIHMYDPDPGPFFSVEGVSQESLRDVQNLAVIQSIAQSLSPELARSVGEAVRAGFADLQKKLPSGVKYELTIEGEGS